MRDQLYIYKFKLERVVDGDTFYGIVDLGFEVFHRIKLRLEDFDAPEVRGKEKVLGRALADWAETYLDGWIGEMYVQTSRTGKYGRWIGKLYLGSDNFSLLLAEKLATLTENNREATVSGENNEEA